MTSAFDPREVVLGLARAELAPPEAGFERSLGDDDWLRLVTTVRAERLAPQLAAGVANGYLLATAKQREEAAGLHARAMATTLLLDRLLLEVVERFERASIDYVALKGAASAHLDRLDPSRRAYGDVDLLVAPPHIDAAERLLADAGGVRAHREPRPGFDRRFSKGASFRMPGSLEVDLHRTLALGPFGLAIEPRQLLAGGQTFALGGRAVRALDRPRRFLHACYHAVLGRARPRVVPLLDVVATAPEDEAERVAVALLAQSWRGGVVVERAVGVARRELHWSPGPSARWGPNDLGVSAQQRRWFAGYVGDARSSARLTLSAVEAIDDWEDRAEYLRAVLWPSRLRPTDAVRRLATGARTAWPGRRHQRG